VYARLPDTAAHRRLASGQGALFVEGLHHALWVSGLALLTTACATAFLLPRGRRNP
jgi:hypothetical protein